LSTSAGPLRVVSSGAFAPACRVLAKQFEQATGVAIDTQTGPSIGDAPNAVPHRLARGEAIDVVVMAGPALADMIAAGYVTERLDLARVMIGVAVRAGAAVPDIATPEALRAALLAAGSIGHSVSVSGAYVRDTLFDRLGIAEAVRGKTRVVLGEPVGAAVARGDIELGFQQMSELKPIAGITVAGPLPAALRQVTVFSAGLVATSTRLEVGRGLMRFLASRDAAPAIIESGMEPA
jgi:molybdate transport system substrate-binding protein